MDPWAIRKRQPNGDVSPDAIFLAVGRALTLWETLESEMAELFDAAVAADRGPRAAFCAFSVIASSSSRTDVLDAALQKALPPLGLSEVAGDVVVNIKRFGARRNEIAHGRVYDLEEFGFYLGPNNIMSRKWNAGWASFQYTAADIQHYASHFGHLISHVRGVTSQVLEARNRA